MFAFTFLTKPAPARPPESTPPDERESVLLRLRQTDAQLDLLADKLKRFRKEHFALVHGTPCLTAARLNEREQLETEYRQLSNEIFRLRSRRSEVLREYAELRGKNR